jgi:hypothetical protein
MSHYSQEELRQIALSRAEALCAHLDGQWHPTDTVHAAASIARDDCELYLWGYEENASARLTIQAQLPEGWGAVEGIAPPEITVRADRSAESIATDIIRRLLPAHADMAARVRTALEFERQQQQPPSIVDVFLALMPGGVPDPHQPGTAASSAGPDAFSSSLRFNSDTQTADVHLRNTPDALARAVVDVVARHLDEANPTAITANQALDTLADAVTGLATARAKIPLQRLLRETALNVLILSRIASNRLGHGTDKDELEELADRLTTALRRIAWSQPQALTVDTSTGQAGNEPPRTDGA